MVLSGRFFYSAEFRIGRFRHRVSAGFRSEKSYRPPAGRMRFSTVRKVFRFFRTFAEPPAPSVRNRRLSGDTASVSFRRPHFGSGDRVSDCRDAFRLVLAVFFGFRESFRSVPGPVRIAGAAFRPVWGFRPVSGALRLRPPSEDSGPPCT